MVDLAVTAPAPAVEPGYEMHRLIADLYPICRSITGDGVRETLARLAAYVPLEIHEVASGTPAFDWTVPREWNIRGAWIKDPSGATVVDFRDCNLHIVSYSVPVRATLTLAELKPHLHSLPEQPELIPYRTSYYAEQWGFCLKHRQLEALADGSYEVMIDATLADGSLTYGECFLPGESEDEVLISCHICHPSLCNDNLSGIALATMLARRLAERPRRYGYRFVFIPGTIGSITWLSRNRQRSERIKHGLVLAGVGDAGPASYKRSRRGDAEIDRAVEHVLRRSGAEHRIIDVFPYGYDERQYCSPGFNLPVGCLMRTPWGEYPQYHTSADNLELVTPAALTDSLRIAEAAIDVLEYNRRYLNRNPHCEPQLGKRGLYGTIGGQADAKEFQLALLWVLNLSDGDHALLDIAERAGLPFELVRRAAEALLQHGLLAERTE